jgi:hypothetical protein
MTNLTQSSIAAEAATTLFAAIIVTYLTLGILLLVLEVYQQPSGICPEYNLLSPFPGQPGRSRFPVCVSSASCLLRGDWNHASVEPDCTATDVGVGKWERLIQKRGLKFSRSRP